MSQLVPIADAADAALKLAADGIARQAPTPLLTDAAAPDPQAAARIALGRAIDGDERAPGWVLLDERGDPRALLAAMVEIVDESHWGYTYLPERFALVPLSMWHVADVADLALLGILVDQLAADLVELDIDRLQVHTRPHDWLAGSAWRDLGLRPDTVMAGRRTSAIIPGHVQAVIRVATTADEDALVALSMEEHEFHAHHTTTGTRANQAIEPTVREVRNSLQQKDPPGVLVACDPGSGDVLSMLSLLVLDMPNSAPSAGFTPSRCGYIGLTSTTASARGRGLGRALVSRAMDEFSRRGLGTVMLHYVADNPLSRSFWNRLGFAPHLVTLAGDVLAARRARLCR